MQTIEELDDGNVLIKIPMVFRTFGGRKRIILPSDITSQNQQSLDKVIILAFARAYYWQKLIDNGVVKDGSEIAKNLGKHSSYILRILRLNYLSPRIVRAVLSGQMSEKLSLNKLLKSFPDEWEEQEKLLLS